MKIAFTSDSALNIIKLPPSLVCSAVHVPVAAASPTGVADGSEAHDGGHGDGGGSAGNRRRRMYDGTYVRTAAYGGIQDRSSIGEKTRVTDSPRITSGKRFFFRLHILLGVWRFYAPT